MTEEWTREELVQRWGGFLAILAEPRLGRTLALYPDERSVYFNYNEIEQHDQALAEQFLERPHTALYAAELALVAIVSKDHRRPRGECMIHFRVRDLPKARSVQVEIRNLRAKHLGRF